jgi:hypothetical protein
VIAAPLNSQSRRKYIVMKKYEEEKNGNPNNYLFED